MDPDTALMILAKRNARRDLAGAVTHAIAILSDDGKNDFIDARALALGLIAFVNDLDLIDLGIDPQ